MADKMTMQIAYMRQPVLWHALLARLSSRQVYMGLLVPKKCIGLQLVGNNGESSQAEIMLIQPPQLICRYHFKTPTMQLQ